MKTKLEMAHEYLLKIMSNSPLVEQVDIEFAVSTAWSYARMMHSEKVKEDKAGYEQKRKEVREMLNAPNTFVEREGQHFDDVEEWQPDWSQAPDDATAWEYLGHRAARWHTTTTGMYRAADLFGYIGTDMLLVERPE